jgi:hypothetical protein
MILRVSHQNQSNDSEEEKITQTKVLQGIQQLLPLQLHSLSSPRRRMRWPRTVPSHSNTLQHLIPPAITHRRHARPRIHSPILPIIAHQEALTEGLVAHSPARTIRIAEHVDARVWRVSERRSGQAGVEVIEARLGRCAVGQVMFVVLAGGVG